MLGAKSIYAKECFEKQFIGANFGIDTDLSSDLFDNWRDFNHKYIPYWLSKHPEKSKVAAGLSCGALWTICKRLQNGSIVLCPDGTGNYYIGEVQGDYYYSPGTVLPHRRNVRWFPKTVSRSEMSEGLRNSTGSIGTVSEVSKFGEEIEAFLSGERAAVLESEIIEDATEFVLEKHLEEFLVRNWKSTELAKAYDIYEQDGELIGQQYQTDTGPIDILALSKDKKILLVIELKKGRVSDNVVGQIQRYMGYVLEELAEKDQQVKGVIIGFEDDIKIRRALAVAPNIDFYRYQITFKLFKS